MKGTIARFLVVGLIAIAELAHAAETAPPPEPSPDRPLTLLDSLRVAFQNHGDVLSAREQLEGARQRVTSSRSPYFPQIRESSTFQRIDQTRNQQVGSVRQFTGRYLQSSRQHSIEVSQTLWDSGQMQAQVRQSRASVRSAEAGVGLARDTVAFSVATAYFQQLRGEKLLSLARQQVEQSQGHLNRVQAQVDAGTSALIDLRPVRVELRQAQFNLVSAENNDRVAATKFRNALGLTKGPRLKLQEVPIPAPATVTGLEDSLTQAKQSRADLRQSRADVAQSESAYDLARIQARPLVTVNSDYNHGLFDSPLDRQWLITGALTVPLFDAGTLRAEVREAQASLAAEKVQLAQREKDVAADVETTHANLGSALDSIDAARALVEEAQENLTAANEKYRLGLGLVIETVDAQVQLFNAETSATQALYDYYVARADLDRAIGRWTSEVP